MKKGDVVTCVDAKSSDYLTTGKKYEVSAGEDDEGVHGYISSNTGFEIVNDMGTKIFCLYPECLHAKWSISE